MTATKKAPAKKRAPAKKKIDVKTGAEAVPTPSQGYYRDPNDPSIKLRRVTTILEQGAPKGGLVWWAGNTVAQSAIENLPWLVTHVRRPEDRDEAYDWLRRAHERKKDERGDIGAAVHTIIECHILGTAIPPHIQNDPEMAPFVVNFLAFIKDWQVTFTASEMVVANYGETRDGIEYPGYAGKLDYMLRSRPICEELQRLGYEVDPEAELDMMGDTKTGGGLDELTSAGNPKGVYPEAGLQMGAYRKGDKAWLQDGTKVDMPPTHPVGIVLHLRPEGYRIYPMRCDEWVFGKFRHIQAVAEWTQLSTSTKQTIRGEPLTNPKKEN